MGYPQSYEYDKKEMEGTVSHTVRHAAPMITNVGTLIRAFETLGWKVVNDATIRTWSLADQKVVYKWVAKNPRDGYDLGIVQDPKTKSVSWAGDTSMMGPDVWAALGDNFCKLKQQYSVQSVLDWADAQSGSVTQSTLANGVISMEVEVEVFS